MKKVFMALALLFLGGCAATQLSPGAQAVRIMHHHPKGCKYVGEVTGNQGNFFTGGWTSNANLETGAMNSMRNSAYNMGGNVVVLLTNRAGQTGNYDQYGGGSQETNVTMTGTAYKCPQSVLNE